MIVGHYVKIVAGIGAQWAVRQAQWPNVFTDEAEDELTDKFKDPQIKWHQAYFDLADDEALVVEVMPPECDYWMIALHNHWMETLDYVNHQSTLNCHSAQLEADGSVRFVVAPRDPGVANWLDTAGHQPRHRRCAVGRARRRRRPALHACREDRFADLSRQPVRRERATPTRARGRARHDRVCRMAGELVRQVCTASPPPKPARPVVRTRSRRPERQAS